MHILNFKKLTSSADKNHMITAVDINSKIDSDFSNDFLWYFKKSMKRQLIKNDFIF